jgi:hypothetical protein
MSLPSESPTPVLDQLVVQASIESFIDCPTGTVEYYFDAPSLTWSDEVYRIHGYSRGDVVPTLDLFRSHVEAQDRDTATGFWRQLTTTGGPLSVYLSLLDAKGRVRKVLVSGDLIVKDETPVGVWALIADLSRSIQNDTKRIANEAVAASALTRAVIEQAKGILMGRAGLDATEAFQRISQRSQTTNRKVVVVSQEIIDRAVQLTQTSGQAHGTKALLELFQTP